MLMISGLPWQLAGYWQDLVFYALLGGVQNIFCKATLTSAKYCTMYTVVHWTLLWISITLHAAPKDLVQMHNAVHWWKEQYNAALLCSCTVIQYYAVQCSSYAVQKQAQEGRAVIGEVQLGQKVLLASKPTSSQHSFHAHKFSWGIFQIRIFSTNIFGQ